VLKWVPSLICVVCVAITYFGIRIWQRIVNKSRATEAAGSLSTIDVTGSCFSGCSLTTGDELSQRPRESPAETTSFGPAKQRSRYRDPILESPAVRLFSAFTNALVLVGGAIAATILFTLIMGSAVVNGHNVVCAVKPSFAWFILPGAIVGLTLSFVYYSALGAVVLMSQAPVRRRRMLAETNASSLSKFYVFFEGIALSGEVFLTLGWFSYILATPNTIIVSQPWSLSRTVYDYRSVQAVEVEKVDMQNRIIHAYTVIFKDGKQWKSQGWIKNVNPDDLERDRQLATYIAQKAGVVIRKVN
jgi:hypothetical protein